MSHKIASLTTLPILQDGRMLKMASSIERWGYESVLIDNSPFSSNSFPFKLLSLGNQPSVSQNTEFELKKALYDAIYNMMPSQIRPLMDRFKKDDYARGYMSYYRDRVLNVLPAADLYLLRSYLQYPALKGKRFIYDASDFYLSLWGNASEFEKRKVVPFHRNIEQQCMEEALVVTTCCEGIASLIKQEFGREAKVIRNCQDKRCDVPVNQTIKKMLGLTDKDFLVVSIGAAKPGLAIAQAIEALKQLPDNVHIAFVGKGHKDCGSRTHSVGAVPANQVTPFISDADCAIILYFNYSGGYHYVQPASLFHAIDARLPILYPLLPDIVSITSRYSVGLPIDPLDSESIANGLRQMVAVKSFFNLDKAAKELSWEQEEIRLKTILEEIL